MAGLSRATINELEAGRLRNLSLTRAERLANELGLSKALNGMRPSKKPRGLELAAQTASVSFALPLPADVLEQAFLHGVMPPGHIPQTRGVLDDAPIALLADVVAEIEMKHGERRKSTWQRMRQLAMVLNCQRGIWK